MDQKKTLDQQIWLHNFLLLSTKINKFIKEESAGYSTHDKMGWPFGNSTVKERCSIGCFGS